MITEEYTRHQFSVIDTAKQLAMFALGSGDCGDAIILRKWLEWRITDGWAHGNPNHESYENAVRSLATEALLVYKSSWVKHIDNDVDKILDR